MKDALFQMFPTKAPGPDGLPAHFFQRHWSLCGEEVTKVVLRILRGGDDPSCVNNTLLVLIPKVTAADELSQFRPISLCNVIYKIASKVAANRLKLVLPQIISEEQSAFVPGRLITDNVITAYECLHFMKKKRPRDVRCCALKLDMKKAYDRVEWDYLRAIMTQLGFHRLWVDMVMRLITTVSFSVLFNGERLNSFLPTRGIRQGDPISPYLFLLAAEGFSCLLNSRLQSSTLKGIKVAPSAPVVSHLLFADDSLLFFGANLENAQVINDVMETYYRASGQQINMDKSSIHFAKGVSNSTREELKNLLNVHNESLSEKYLGMPSDVGVSANGAFKYLKDTVWKRVQGWMEQSLSAGGKEVLIKAVVQAIPTYSMSCFKLPKGLCEHINGIVRSFWWGSKEGKRKPCWVAWDEMIKPKNWGGLGFRDIELFNLALLARQAWRILNDANSLSARILKAVYYPEAEFLDADVGSSPSRMWRAISEGKDALVQGLIRRIGTEETTNIWSMNWLPRDGQFRPLTCTRADAPQMVKELVDPLTLTWDHDKLQRFFTPLDAEVISSIPLTTRRQDDFWAWHYEKTGVFSVKSAYRMLVQKKENLIAWLEHTPSTSDIRANEKEWTAIWQLKVPSKIKVFLWRLARHSIPTADVLHRRHIAPHAACLVCGVPDSWKHSLLECNLAKCVWALMNEETVEHICNVEEHNAKAWLAEIISSLPKEESRRVVVTMWAVWHAKWKAVYENIF